MTKAEKPKPMQPRIIPPKHTMMLRNNNSFSEFKNKVSRNAATFKLKSTVLKCTVLKH